MANTGEQIGVNYKTLMPDLTDIADIQQAYQMYHVGIADWDGITPPAANSIEGHLSSVNSRVDELEARPVGGGEVSTTEPVAVGPQLLPVPEGYVWVDQDAVATEFPQMPTVIYSPTQPTGLTTANVGTIWVDQDGTTEVLNTTDYIARTEAETTLQPKTPYVTNAPSNPTVGQMWMNADENVLYFWNGSAWVEVSGGMKFDFLLMGA